VIPPPRFFFGASAALLLFFLVWSWLVLQEEGMIAAFDDRCANFWRDWSRDHRGWAATMYFLTDLGSIAAMTLVAIMGSLWQSAIKHRVLAAAWLGVVIGGGLLNMATKDLFARARPDVAIRDTVIHETNNSYPSGHAMGSAIGYGMLGYALILPQRHRPRRVVAILLMIAIVLGVGFSRFYLRAHWVSDVIGGWTIGVAWLFFCLGWLERYRRKQP
jgi:undecaprenyl-diphosphatase